MGVWGNGVPSGLKENNISTNGAGTTGFLHAKE